MGKNPKFFLQINVPITKSTFCGGQKHVQARGLQLKPKLVHVHRTCLSNKSQ